MHYVQRNINPTSWKCYCCAPHSLVISVAVLTAAFICWSLLNRSALWPASEALSSALFPCHTHLPACSNRQAKFKLDTPTYVAMSLLYPALALLQSFLYFPLFPDFLIVIFSHGKNCCGVESDHQLVSITRMDIKKDHNSLHMEICGFLLRQSEVNCYMETPARLWNRWIAFTAV